MYGFDDLWIWRDPDFAGQLGWYRDVAADRRPAKFRIGSTVPIAIELTAADEAMLWAELDRLTPLLLERWQQVREGAPLGLRADGASLLDLCRELALRMLTHCNFCRWDCRVDRSLGRKLGACKLQASSRVSSWFHHPGEELVYRGHEGSGTIFFTSCNMRCAFCQNGDISTDKDNGEEAGARAIATMAWLLRKEGCHNVNWVGGEVTIHLHRIVEAIALLGAGFVPTRADLREALPTKADRWSAHDPEDEGSFAGGFNVPMLWNSNFFMSPEAMRILRLLMDVWLPDFKFGPGRCAMELAKTPWYWETVTANLSLVHAWGEEMTIRHLVMPGHVECCTWPVLEWIAEHMPEVPVNIMDQYHPDNFCDPRSAKYRPQYAANARPPRRQELEAAWARARELGLAFETISFEKRRRARWEFQPYP